MKKKIKKEKEEKKKNTQKPKKQKQFNSMHILEYLKTNMRLLSNTYYLVCVYSVLFSSLFEK